MENNKSVIEEFTKEIEDADTQSVLYGVKVKYTGKKGIITTLGKEMGNLSAEERPAAGARLHELRIIFTELYDKKETFLKQKELDEKLLNERLDITLDGVAFPSGSLHPVNMIYDEIVELFIAMGYSVATGPEAELDLYNFESLNMPQGHPARDMQDTFYLSERMVLRTHTSPVQVRTMLKEKPPIRIIAPGKVYRSDYDVSHSPMFHQVEGLLIDEGISLAHLKGTVDFFIKRLFGNDVPVRFRPSYFPFTEPSMEVDMGCTICKSKGCRVCKHTGWLEIGGSGLVAPEVLDAVGIDKMKYSGFAFGMGLERIAMIKYGIDDIRLFFENSSKFLTQF